MYSITRIQKTPGSLHTDTMCQYEDPHIVRAREREKFRITSCARVCPLTLHSTKLGKARHIHASARKFSILKSHTKCTRRRPPQTENKSRLGRGAPLTLLLLPPHSTRSAPLTRTRRLLTVQAKHGAISEREPHTSGSTNLRDLPERNVTSSHAMRSNDFDA